MKITKKDIIAYREEAKKAWHNEAWHSFMNTKKSEAIGYALQALGKGASYADISKEANEYSFAISDII